MLNRLLREPSLADTAVVINEIGSVAIDHHLVERVEPGEAIDVMVLKGGCACCTLRGDVAAALRELYARRADKTLPWFRRVVLETSGLADPAPVLFTLTADPALRHKFELGVVLTMVDALHGVAQAARHPEWHKQVAVADRLVISKSDLGNGVDTERLAALLAGINPAADVVDAHGARDIGAFLAAAFAFAPRRPTATAARDWRSFHGEIGPSAAHTADVSSAAIVLEQPLEWSAFAVWLTLLLHAHGNGVLRFKALLGVENCPTPVVLDGVHHLIHAPRHLATWPAGPRLSRLVFIAQSVPVERIERSLLAWV